jgi:small-conductance mechanosensitive channel
MIEWLDAFAIIVSVFQAATWASVALKNVIDRTIRKRLDEDPSSVSAFGLMGFFGRVAIWAVALLLTLQNLGINVTALVATFGVGGIAIAFALQNILGDVFCSIAILLDKPFVVGDFIIVGDLMGSVEHIGIKTTRLRSLGGEQIVFSNADLLASRIRNYKRMYERRVLYTFGIVYETPLESIEAVPGIVREIIESIEDTRFDRAHFKTYGDFALMYEVVYYVLDPDYNRYMDIQEEINMRTFRAFKERGIQFAYPTRELIIRPNGSVPPAATQNQLVPGDTPEER